MEIKSAEFEKFADIMANDVVSKLTGEHENFKRFYANRPSDDIFIGNIAESFDIDNNEDNEKLKYLTNSESVKFLVEKITDDITVSLKLFVYYRVFPTYDEQVKYRTDKTCSRKCNLVPIWKRKTVEFNDITISNLTKKVELNFKDNVEEILSDEETLLNRFKISKEASENKETFDKEIAELKKKSHKFKLKWKSHLKVTRKQFTQNNKKLKIIELAIVNNSVEQELKERGKKIKDQYFEPNLFDVRLDISLNNNQVIPFEYEYDYDGYPKTYKNFSRTLNCHADYDEEENKFITMGYTKFKQEKISPKSNLENINIDFITMSSKSGIENLEKIYESMVSHYGKCKRRRNKSDEYLESLNNFDLMQKRFEEGINLLKSDKNVFRAFSLMNRTFHENSKNKDYHSWRLFQIVFIVSLLKDIVEKDYNKDTCELLHVMTGGGKSEAYFGLVIFSAFYDRITGKEYGVTAITKFPLRMLSVQQLQRMSSLFIWAEELRQEKKLGGDNFSIAYFVGNSTDFPRHNDKLIYEINELKTENKRKKGQIIDKCPICGGDVYLDVLSPENLVVHHCKECSRKFKLLFCDDEIYRTLPTFIVATVDKFAGIAMQRRFKNLFGGKVDTCPENHGFIPHNDVCEVKTGFESCGCNGTFHKVNYCTGPSLIIQDELHLINEGFGAIDSHFETLMETMQEEFTDHKFKNIAMTATVTGAKNQIKQLYNKKTCIFPPKLEDSKGNDFFFQKEKEGRKPIIQRTIIGLKPNTVFLRLNFYILRYISEFIKYVEENKKEFFKEYKFKLKELNEIIEYYKKVLTYHNKKEDVQSIPYNAHSFIDSYESTYDLYTRTLTGENNLDYIKDTINLVETFYDNEDEKENRKDKLLVVSATSIVSHGVDIDEWNAMIFDSMPRSTSEYIQALSRVGRKKCGIIFLSFRGSRTRDLSFYQHFDEYHNILDHKVEVVPLSRWTKIGFKQTLTSIFTASVLNYMSNSLNKPLYKLNEFKKVFSNEDNRKEIIEFIKKVYLCDKNLEESKDICKKIDEEINDRIDKIMDSSYPKSTFIVNALKESNNPYYKTQYGMRGIQDEITLDSDNKDDFFRKNWKGSN